LGNLNRALVAIVWAAVAIACVVPITVAAMSPLLEWRSSIYIAAGFGGVIAMSLLLLQPLLSGELLPGISLQRSRRAHRFVGAALVFLVVIHVIGLWITSPPDVIDALLFVSATPFSNWGVIAMWSVFASALLVLFRRRFNLRAHTWRLTHRALACISVAGSVVHALMIEGAMGMMTKSVLCVLLVVATGFVLIKFLRGPSS